MPTYVSELRRTKETKKVKVEYKNNTLVEKIVIGSPAGTLKALTRTDLTLSNMADVTDSDGNLISGVLEDSVRASQGFAPIQNGSILQWNTELGTTGFRKWEAKTILDRQTINGGTF